MHPNSEELFKKYALEYFDSAKKVLELGPDGSFTYLEILNEAGFELEYHCADVAQIDHPNYIRFTDPYHIDTNQQFDVVFAGQVINYVRKPWLWLRELSRVTRIGGHIIIIANLSWEYCGHDDIVGQEVDCWRIFPEGMRVFFEEAGLQCVLSECENLVGMHCEHQEVLDTIAIARR